MKILIHGTIPGKRKIQGTCHNCGCKIEALAEECTYVPDQRDGDFWQYKCPTPGCGQNISLYTNGR